MHLSFDLCAEEKAFLSRRKRVAARALKQALQLEGDLQEHEVWERRGCGADTLAWTQGSACFFCPLQTLQPAEAGQGACGGDVGHAELWGSNALWGSVQGRELSLPGEGLDTSSNPDSIRP